MGLAAYRYLAQRVDDHTEVQWATTEYDALLAATSATLDATITRSQLNYLPCSMTEPNTSNRCNKPEDANWAAPFQFGKWAWDAQLFDAPVSGPGLTLIDGHLLLRIRSAAGRAPPEHVRRLSIGLLLDRLQTPATAAGAWPAHTIVTRGS